MATEPTEPTDPQEPAAEPTPEPSSEPAQPLELPDDHPVLKTMRTEREQRKQLEQQIAELRKAQMSETERAIAEAREQAVAEARQEWDTERQTIARERMADRVRVAAAKDLNDPEDAVRLIDLDSLDPSTDDVDAEIASRLASLVEAKPYLKVSETHPSGSRDAGSRTDSLKPSQLTRQDLSNMTPQQIETARKEGRLDEMLGSKH